MMKFYKMKFNLMLFCGIVMPFFLSTMSAQSKHDGCFLNRLATEAGVSMTRNDGNLSPFGLQYSEQFAKPMLSVHAQILYKLEHHMGFGIEFQTNGANRSLEGLSINDQTAVNYVGLAIARTYAKSRSSWFLKSSISAGYANVNHAVRPWKGGDDPSISAHGLSANCRITVAYKFSRRQALGLQLGLQAYNFAGWKGTSTLINEHSSTPGIFKQGNAFYSVGLGVVLTNPLNR